MIHNSIWRNHKLSLKNFKIIIRKVSTSKFIIRLRRFSGLISWLKWPPNPSQSHSSNKPSIESGSQSGHLMPVDGASEAEHVYATPVIAGILKLSTSV